MREALHCAIAWYLHCIHASAIIELFCTTMSHIRDFGLNYRGRLQCTYETSAESVKFYLKSDERRGARQVAIIDRAVIDRYNVQRQLSCRTGNRTQIFKVQWAIKCSSRSRELQHKFLQTAAKPKADSKAQLIVSIYTPRIAI